MKIIPKDVKDLLVKYSDTINFYETVNELLVKINEAIESGIKSNKIEVSFRIMSEEESDTRFYYHKYRKENSYYGSYRWAYNEECILTAVSIMEDVYGYYADYKEYIRTEGNTRYDIIEFTFE